jgi:hypothetical protein
MADVKFAVTQFDMSIATAGTQYDIDAPLGFGTPKAAIFIYARGLTDELFGASDRSFGFTDGTNQYSATHAIVGSGTTTNNNTWQSNTECISIVLTNRTGTISRHRFISFKADGATLEVIQPNIYSRANACIVVWIGGTDVANAFVGTESLGNSSTPVDVIAPGFEPSLLFGVDCGRTNFNTQNTGSVDYLSWGVAVNDVGAPQKSTTIRTLNGATTQQVLAYSASDRFTAGFNAVNSASALIYTTQVSDFDAQGFTLTPVLGTGTPSNHIVGYLALEITGGHDVGLVDTYINPTVTSYSEAGFSFQPGFGLVDVLSSVLAHDIVYTSGSQIAVGTAAAFDVDTIWSNSNSTQDGTGTHNADTITESALTILNVDGSSRETQSTVYSMTPSGWDFTLAGTGAGSQVRGWALAIAPQDAPGVTFDGPNIVAQTGTENQVFSFDENSEGTVASRFTGATTYALSPDSDALPTGLTVNATTGNIEGTPTEVATRNIIIRGSA